MERALNELKERIAALNADESVSQRVSRAVAFGDFLLDRVRVQAADVGIELQPRNPAQIGKKETAIGRIGRCCSWEGQLAPLDPPNVLRYVPG